MKRPFDLFYVGEAFLELIPYLAATFIMLCLSVIIGGLLGALFAWVKIRRKPISTKLVNVYIYIIRACPSVVLLFIVFYGVPELLLRLFDYNANDFPKLVFVVTTFSLLFAATMTEVIRSSYEAIDQGQREAAISLGLSEWQANVRIIFPQAAIVALPNFVNSLIILLKEGALAYTIGFIDIMGKGILMIGNQYGAHALEIYLALGIIYWIVTICFETGFRKLEQRLGPDRNLKQENLMIEERS